MKLIQSVAHSSGAAEQKRVSDNHNTVWWYSRAAAMAVVVKACSSTQQQRLACSIRLMYKWYYKEFTAAQQCTLLIHTSALLAHYCTVLQRNVQLDANSKKSSKQANDIAATTERR
eukprot:17454-Heterococcus_DN1.PRE.5